MVKGVECDRGHSNIIHDLLLQKFGKENVSLVLIEVIFFSGSTPVNGFFPQTSHLNFDQLKVDSLMKKLEEFNEKVEEKVALPDLMQVRNSLNSSTTSSDSLQVLQKMLTWPSGQYLPTILF